jgi:hypothetical protein
MFYKRIIFAALLFLGRVLRNYKNTLVRNLSHEHPLKHPTRFYFYNVHYLRYRRPFSKFLYIRELSHGMVF